MPVEGVDIKKPSIRRMSCRNERRRHVWGLPHGFWVCVSSFDNDKRGCGLRLFLLFLWWWNLEKEELIRVNIIN